MGAGLVSLIFLGRELCRHCLILSPVLFGPALYSIFKIYQFLIYFSPLFLCSVLILVLASALNVLLLPFPTMWLTLLSEHDHIHPMRVPKVMFLLNLKLEIEVTAPASSNICSNYIIYHRHFAIHCCLQNTMFTFSIVVIDIGVPYFVQVIGGGL